MARIVRSTGISNETWLLLDRDESTTSPRSDGAQAETNAADPTGILVPLDAWIAARDARDATAQRVGVFLKNTDDPRVLAPRLDAIDLIAVDFPRFTDGRGYSIARMLRGRLGFRGELRAVGDIMRDQIFYLMRVGFDAFELRADQDAEVARSALRDFSESYQSSSDQPPLYARRRVA